MATGEYAKLRCTMQVLVLAPLSERLQKDILIFL
jgi:hypothetical protein